MNDITKRETEGLRKERMDELNKIKKIKTAIKDQKMKRRFNELADNLDLR